MWRLLAVVALVALVWGANELLPATNNEEQLRAVTGIAAGAAPTFAKAMAVTKAAAPVSDAQPLQPVPSARASLSLVMSLQEELTRVGCYKGALDGSWSPATQRAAARFAGRIETRIDADVPPAALLPMVVKYGDRACGTPCPPGSQPNRQGACTTKQTVALAAPAEANPSTPLLREPAQVASYVIVSPGRGREGPAGYQNSANAQAALAEANPGSLAGKVAAAEAGATRTQFSALANLGSEASPPAPVVGDAVRQAGPDAQPLAVAAAAPLLTVSAGPPAETARPQNSTRPTGLVTFQISPGAAEQHLTAVLPILVVANQEKPAPPSPQASDAAQASAGLPAEPLRAKHKRFRKPAIARAAVPQLAAAQDVTAPSLHKRRASARTVTTSFGFAGGGGGSSSPPLAIVLSRH